MPPGTSVYPTALDTTTELIQAVNDSRGVIATGGATNSATTVNITSVPSSAPGSGIAVIVSATDDTVREIVSYSGKTATSILSVTRNLESSGAKTWLAGDIVYFDVLTALSRAVLVNAIIALETKLGSGADTPDGGKVLKATGTGTSGWLDLTSSDIADADALVQAVHAAVSHNVASNNSTTTYATHISTTKVLPAGTWDCTVVMNAGYFGNTGTSTVVESRIGSPMTGTAQAAANQGSDRFYNGCTASGSVVSNGSTPTTFTGQFRRQSGDTVRAEAGTLTAICVRTA